MEKVKTIVQKFEQAKTNNEYEVALFKVNDLLELDPNNSQYLKEKHLVSRALNIELDIGFIRKLCWHNSTDEECFYSLAQKYNTQNDQYSALLASAFSLSVAENYQVRELLEKNLLELGFSSLAIYIMKTNRIGHLTCEPDSWLRQQSQSENLDSKELNLFVCNGEISNLTFFETLKRYITIVESDFFHRLHRSRPQLLSSEFYRKMPYDLMSVYYPRDKGLEVRKGIAGDMYKNMSDIYATSNRVIKLTNAEKETATKYLKQIGIDSTAKIVCLHVRDSEYLAKKSTKNFSYHDYRDASVDNYLPSINYLINQGYTVVRLGVISNQHLNFQSSSYFDLTTLGDFEDVKNAVDVFLLSHCHFFIGTTSGPSSLAAVFDTPTLSVNSAPICHHYGVKSRSIFKYVIRNGERLNFISIVNGLTISDSNQKKIIDCFDSKEMSDNDLTYVENTPEDILDAVTEFEEIVRLEEIDSEIAPCQKKYISQIASKNGLLAGSAIPTASFLQKHKTLFNLI
ncbi:TIGR04372 family glycosyltransferase [Paraglaciecola sp. MB-3u-78]|uniref:TIGR04372 family glycosyltransferase n=1 Tax=Paraglaciecola sp. MB-3u-78 TaxID=2058332 RepID=UPI000C33DCD8|nr:TIGR04372 family glycosyltransferase [Paraglaciecola sp. MB-3u-78]PKH00832.1 hypothetical protein CXF95_01005 [Paraglaciecola sp. MB-3u-78]